LAEILGVKPWEVADIPIHWIEKAEVVYYAKREAAMAVAEKGAFPVYEIKF
jgi:hypothetical protein